MKEKNRLVIFIEAEGWKSKKRIAAKGSRSFERGEVHFSKRTDGLSRKQHPMMSGRYSSTGRNARGKTASVHRTEKQTATPTDAGTDSSRGGSDNTDFKLHGSFCHTEQTIPVKRIPRKKRYKEKAVILKHCLCGH